MAPRWTRARWLDLLFVVGLGVKALDGLVELVVGIPLAFLDPSQIQDFLQWATQDELSENPHDPIAAWVLHLGNHLNPATAGFTAAYLLLHGGVKIAIVTAIFVGSRKIYPWAVAALAGFLVWQGYEMVVHPSWGMFALCVMDAAVLALTFREWRHHRSLRDAWRSLRGREVSGEGA